MIRCCATNRFSITPRCGRVLPYLQSCNALQGFESDSKTYSKCNMSANSCEKHALRIGVASWRCKLTSVTPHLFYCRFGLSMIQKFALQLDLISQINRKYLRLPSVKSCYCCWKSNHYSEMSVNKDPESKFSVSI